VSVKDEALEAIIRARRATKVMFVRRLREEEDEDLTDDDALFFGMCWDDFWNITAFLVMYRTTVWISEVVRVESSNGIGFYSF